MGSEMCIRDRRNTQQLDLLQAQIYAEDLSKLLARTRQRSTA